MVQAADGSQLLGSCVGLLPVLSPVQLWAVQHRQNKCCSLILLHHEQNLALRRDAVCAAVIKHLVIAAAALGCRSLGVGG